MELSSKIRELRVRDGISQEVLAERIYVTRQTVSNWETGKSYPDVQSLLMLSVLFNVSLDELVKGDMEMMRSELDAYKMKVLSFVMLAFVVLAAVSAVPMVMVFDWPGMVLPAILFVCGIAVGFVLERIKKKHNIQAYSEVVAFVEGKTPRTDAIPWGRKHPVLFTLIKVAGGAVFGLLLSLLGWLIWALMSGGIA